MYRYPFTPFPSSWYKLFLSDEVRPNQKKECFACGKKWLVSRNRTSAVEVFAIEENRTLIKWTSCEINGVIFLYYDPQQNPCEFEIPEIPEFLQNNSKWMKPFKLNFRSIAHIQEVAENALDTQHFSRVHDYIDTPIIEVFTIERNSFRVKLKSNRSVFGKFEKAIMDITYHGLGVVHATVSTETADLRVLLMTTPTKTEEIEITMRVALNKTNNWIRNIIYRVFLPGIISRDFAKDIPIWDNKRYHVYPNLCRNDGEIMKIRQWAKRFY